MSKTEVTMEHLDQSMELARRLGEVLNGHPLYIGLSALTMIEAHLLVTNEHVAPAERAAALADEQLRQAITYFRMLESERVRH